VEKLLWSFADTGTIKHKTQMHKYATFLIFLFPFLALGADSTGTNHLFIAATGQYNLNKWNVYNSSQQPNLLQANNTLGQNFSVGYRRVTKYGLMIMVGIGLSTREHDITIQKNLKDYDPAYSSNRPLEINLKFKIRSIDPEVMIGYRKDIGNKNALSIKAGVIQKRFINDQKGGTNFYSTSPLSNNYMLTYDMEIGKPTTPNIWLEKLYYYNLLPQFSIGFEHNYNKKYFKYLSVEMNMILMKPLYRTHSQEVEVVSVNNVNTTSVSASNYIDYFASVGLRVSMGLWK
jgi:hypothetical protein